MELIIPIGFEEFYLEELSENLCCETLENKGKQLVLISAPAEFDISSLKGEQVVINGCKSLDTIPPQSDEDLKWELHSSTSKDKHLNILLPSSIQDKHVLAGDLALSLNVVRNISIPSLTFPDVVGARLPKPQGLRARWKPFGHDSPGHQPIVNGEIYDTLPTDSPKKKKKKKKKDKLGNNIDLNDTCIAHDIKTPTEDAPMKKKRKKDKSEESNLEALTTTDILLNGTCIPTNLKTEPETTPTKKEKKKKKKREMITIDSNPVEVTDLLSNGTCILSNSVKVEDVSDTPSKKKKLKKKDPLENIVESILESGKSTDLSEALQNSPFIPKHIKTELERSPSKKKIQNKGGIEANFELNNFTPVAPAVSNVNADLEETPRKKKRKKKEKVEGSNLIAHNVQPISIKTELQDTPLQNTPLQVEVENTENKKKRKKKKKDKLEETTTDISISCISAGIKVEQEDTPTKTKKKKKKQEAVTACQLSSLKINVVHSISEETVLVPVVEKKRRKKRKRKSGNLDDTIKEVEVKEEDDESNEILELSKKLMGKKRKHETSTHESVVKRQKIHSEGKTFESSSKVGTVETNGESPNNQSEKKKKKRRNKGSNVDNT